MDVAIWCAHYRWVQPDVDDEAKPPEKVCCICGMTKKKFKKTGKQPVIGYATIPTELAFPH